MAFISMLHNFSGDFQLPPTTLPIWYNDTTSSANFLDNYGIIMAHEYDIPGTRLSRSSSWENSFPESLMVVPTSPIGLSSISSGGSEYPKVEQDEVLCSSGGFVANSRSSYPIATNNWETESQKPSKEVEEPMTIKIGKYSSEERKDKIMKYLKKRNQRNFNKTIKYECRKTLADKRIRVRGRFAKNNNDHHQQLCDDQVLPIITDAGTTFEEDTQRLYANNFPMKENYDEEEEWLQEAMASLLYSPLIN